jgi:hypothetical protein
MNRIRFVCSEVLFWMHALIFIVWVLLFFIPQSIWPEKITFHLFYIIVMIVAEFLAGLVLMPVMGKFRIVCPLTTLMQQVRGVSFREAANYDHSFVREFAERMHVKVPYGFVGALIFFSLAVVAIQFLTR